MTIGSGGRSNADAVTGAVRSPVIVDTAVSGDDRSGVMEIASTPTSSMLNVAVVTIDALGRPSSSARAPAGRAPKGAAMDARAAAGGGVHDGAA